MKYCFGVDIGGTTVKLGLFSEAGAIVEKWEIVTRTEDEGSAILPDIAEAINGKLEQHGIEKEQILGIGVGVPAPVTADGIVNGSANLGWKYKNAKKELEELTDLKAEFGNDANVAALGEMWKGGGVGYRNMIMVTLGTGVGGGIIINGKILTGENGAGGEIGHMCVNLEETDTCGCGRHGCLEQYASATGISRLARKKMEHETRATILGHMQRGGEPCPYDRVISSRLGAAAARLIIKEKYGYMVGFKDGEIVPVPLGEVAGKLKMVDPDSSIIKEAKGLGICFGD